MTTQNMDLPSRRTMALVAATTAAATLSATGNTPLTEDAMLARITRMADVAAAWIENGETR